MSREEVDITLGTHTSLLASFLGLQNIAFITFKLSMTSKARNLPCNFVAMQRAALTT
jgi:hypothetical protein